MPDCLQIIPEEIDTLEKRAKYTVSVIGCGREGVLYAIAFSEAGFRVICTDDDQSIVKKLGKGKSAFVDDRMEVKLKSFTRSGQLGASSEPKSAVAQSDIIVMTNAVRISANGTPDYSEIEGNCKQVGTSLRRGTVVIYGSVAGFGFTEDIIKEKLENASGFKVGQDFGLAYCPVQILEDQISEAINNQELQVAATEKTSLTAASTVLGTLTKKGIRKISNIRTAELATLFTAVQREINIALANELAILCENCGQDYFEIRALLNKGNSTNFAHPTISEENYRTAAYLLLEAAESLRIKLRIPAIATQTNEEMIKHAVNLTQGALRKCGKTLRRARIGLLGLPRPKTAAHAFAKALEAKGARINIYDPTLSENEVAERAPLFKKTLNETIEGTDCVIVLTEQDQIKRLNFKKLHAAMKTPAAIVDLVGVLEQDKVEKEEFIYRSIGKGTGK